MGLFLLSILILKIQADGVDGFSSVSSRVNHRHCRISRSSPTSTVSQSTATTLFSTTDKPETKSSTSPWDDFDYMQHWYPVSWLEDILPNKPTKITLFDVDYVVARTDDSSVMALQDKCPHKSAALSEGRVTATGFIQCAYHGWSFDKDGKCVQVPQAPANAVLGAKSCAKAIPAKIHQGLIWLWPGPVTEQLPDPPSVPEMNDPAYRTFNKSVRDFPCIDWSLLLSNIMDPDHGVFAHQSAPFDMYSASKEMPLELEQSFENHGWVLTSRVPAQEKLLKTDKKKRGKKLKEMPSTIVGTTTFYAPNHVTICRRDQETNQTSFVATFWVCPTGTGRSRFLSAAVGKVPFSIPRWMTHIGILNFLDQDSVLVASQQPHVLGAEADAFESGGGARKKLYSYQSPSDRAVSLIAE